MIRNRKARLLLGVPANVIGGVSYYRLTASRTLYCVGVERCVDIHNETRAAKRRRKLRYRQCEEDLARWRASRVRSGIYESLLPHVGKPMSSLANMDLSAIEARIAAAYAPEAADKYAALSIGRQVHVEGDRLVSESPDLSITLLDGAGKPVADFDYVARTFSMPGTFELARKAITDLNQRTEEILRKVIAERYGDVDLEVFAKDSLRKVWPDREEYFYKDDLLLTVHKPRWDEITFEIHRGSKNGD